MRHFMVRYLVFAGGVTLAAALALWLVLAPSAGSTESGDVAVRAARVAKLAIEKHRLEVTSVLSRVATNRFVVASADELDGEAVARALRDFCATEGLRHCAAFDGDGDLLASVDGDAGSPGPLSSELRQSVTGESGPVLANLAAGESGLEIVGLAVIGSRDDASGFVRGIRQLGNELARDVGLAVGQRVALLARDGRILSSNLPDDLRPGASGAVGAAWSAPANTAHTESGVAVAVVTDGVAGAPPLAVAVVLESVTTNGPAAKSLFGLFAAALLGLLSVGAWVLTGTSRLARSYSDALEVHAANVAGAPLLVPQGGGSFAKLASTLNAFLGQVAQEMQRAREQLKEMEVRFERVHDLIGIDDGAFRMLDAKVRGLTDVVESEVTALMAEPRERDHRISAMLRAAHTLKVNARLFRVQRVAQAARDLEDTLAAAKKRPTVDQATATVIRTHLAQARTEADAYRELRGRLLGDADRGARAEGRAALRLQWMVSLIGRLFATLKDPRAGERRLGRLADEYQDAVSSLGREDLLDYVKRYDLMLREIAGRAGKALKPIVWRGNCRFFPYATMQLLNDALLHCLRNALDHGIEPALKRVALGKDEMGRITIESNLIGGFCVIVVKDDGRGIDANELGARAVERGYVKAEVLAKMSPEQRLDLAFVSGFSTAQSVTDVSGRGVGMEVVREVARELGGDARLMATPGKGTEIHLHLPYPESRFHNRQSVFNIHAEVSALAQALAPQFKQTTLRFEVDPSVRFRALVHADRILFNAVFKELLQGLNTYARKPATLVLGLEHASDNGSCSLETFSLRLAVIDESGRPDVGPAKVLGLLDDADFAGLLLECGMYLESGAEGELVLHIPAGAAGLVPDAPVPVLALVNDHAAARDLFQRVSLEFYGGMSCDVVGADKIHAFVEAGGSSRGVVVLDDQALADPEALAELQGLADLNLIVVTKDVQDVPLVALLKLSRDPLLIEGELDEAAAAQALEYALARLVGHMGAQAPLPVETLAA